MQEACFDSTLLEVLIISVSDASDLPLDIRMRGLFATMLLQLLRWERAKYAFCVQALWSQAREQAHVITIICANNTYNILKVRPVFLPLLPFSSCIALSDAT